MRTLLGGLAVAGLAAVGCGPSEPEGEGCRYHLRTDVLGVPFPSDLTMTEPDGASPTGVRLAYPEGEMYGLPDGDAALRDGFPPMGRIVLAFDEELAEDSLDRFDGGEGSPVVLVGVSEAVRGQTVQLLPGFDRYSNAVLVLRPGAALERGERYATVLRSDLATGEAEDCVARADESQRDAEALAAAEAAGLNPEEVAAAIPFTVASHDGLVTDMVTVASEALAAGASTPTFDQVHLCSEEPETPGCFDGVERVAYGHATAPRWTEESDGSLCGGEGGGAAPCGEVEVPLLLVVPPEAAAGPVPLLIYIHGISDSREATFDLGGTIPSSGWAILAYDLPVHGERTPEDTAPAMALFGVEPEVMQTSVFRANMYQAVSDATALVVMLRRDAQLVAGDLTVSLDTSTMSLLGSSLGGITGTLVCAVCPPMDRCALNVPGGRLTDILEFHGLYRFLVDAYVSPGNRPLWQLYLAMGQALINPVDPAIYAPHIVVRPLAELGAEPTDVLVQQADSDTTIRAFSTGALTRAGQIPLLGEELVPMPGLATGSFPAADNLSGTGEPATAGLVQFVGAHDAIYVERDPSSPGVAMQTQALHLFTTGEIAAP